MQQFERLQLTTTQLASYMYLPSPSHGSSSAQTGTSELKHLLDQFARMRKQQRDDAVPH